MALERLQKIIAATGLTSRRKAEQLILEGAVSVNGHAITTLGAKADPKKDKIKVNGKLIFTETEFIYVVFNKPAGVLCSLSDPEGRKTLTDYLRILDQKVLPIGRLDFTSEGLLLLTNDGSMVNLVSKLKNIPRTYSVKVKGHYTTKDLLFLKDGIFTQEGVVKFQKVTLEEKLKNKTWISFEVIQGANLNLREIFNHRGLLVDRIVRTAIGSLKLGVMEAGEFSIVQKETFEKLLVEDKNREKMEIFSSVTAKKGAALQTRKKAVNTRNNKKTQKS